MFLLECSRWSSFWSKTHSSGFWREHTTRTLARETTEADPANVIWVEDEPIVEGTKVAA